MKKYRLNNRTITVRKGSIAHRVLEHLPVLAGLGLLIGTAFTYAFMVLCYGLVC